MNPNLKTVITTCRIPFLTLAAANVILALTTINFNQKSVMLSEFFICLIGALAAHIAVNTLNEYQDFHSGLDFKTDRSPFNGGSGGLVENPDAAPAVLNCVFFSVLVTILVGIYFLISRGTAILPIGLLGLLIVILYTNVINRFAVLCLFAPGIGFGSLIYLGSYYVLAGAMEVNVGILSLVSMFLVNNVLLLSQIPDLEADKTVGRRHIVITVGIKNSLKIYLLFLILALSLLVFSIIAGLLPTMSALTFIPLTAGFVAFKLLYQDKSAHKDKQVMNKALALNVVCANASLFTLALTLYFC